MQWWTDDCGGESLFNRKFLPKFISSNLVYQWIDLAAFHEDNHIEHSLLCLFCALWYY